MLISLKEFSFKLITVLIFYIITFELYLQAKICAYKTYSGVHNNCKEVIVMLKIPKGYDTTSKTFRLPVELVEKMENIAFENKISLNKLVIQCLLYAVDNIEENQE